MIIIREIDKVVSIKLKRQLVFKLLELIVILAAIAIIAAIAVPRFIDFYDRACKKLFDASIAKLNGREKLAFANIIKSQDGIEAQIMP